MQSGLNGLQLVVISSSLRPCPHGSIEQINLYSFFPVSELKRSVHSLICLVPHFSQNGIAPSNSIRPPPPFSRQGTGSRTLRGLHDVYGINRNAANHHQSYLAI